MGLLFFFMFSLGDKVNVINEWGSKTSTKKNQPSRNSRFRNSLQPIRMHKESQKFGIKKTPRGDEMCQNGVEKKTSNNICSNKWKTIWEKRLCKKTWLVVSTHLKNISQFGSSSPGRGENKKYLKPPPGRWLIPLFTGFYASQVVNAGFQPSTV